MPAGWGAPVYGKLDAELAAALMSINAAKGVEIGEGFAAAALTGEENADEMRMQDGEPAFLANHAGGILGGISTGQEIVCRLAFKPTCSILSTVRSVDRFGKEIELRTKGRHDPCVGLRATPVVEAMVACVLADTCCATAPSAAEIGFIMLFRTASVPLAHAHERGRVEDGRGFDAEVAPFPVPAHQTGRADFPHPAFRLASSPGSRRDTQHLRPQHPSRPKTSRSGLPPRSALWRRRRKRRTR